MELMQRFNAAIIEDEMLKYVDEMLKHPGSCDNIWLSTKYGFPKLEEHKRYAQVLCGYAEKIRAKGLSISLQLSNTLGHGAKQRDCSGMVYENSPYEKMVGPDGTAAGYSFCWRGENVKAYVKKELEYYMSVQPDTLWIDDDLRAQHHPPLTHGCFCDSCLSLFNEKYNSNLSREKLVSEILHGDLVRREQWISFVREGLYDFTYMIGKTVKQFSPDTTVGLQITVCGAYIGHGIGFLFDALRDSTGKNPKSRPGGGVYDGHNPVEFINKAMSINFQNYLLPDYVQCKCPEIENIPYVSFGKSPASTAFETSLYFACGNTDMSYSMAKNNVEPISWYAKAFQLFSEQRRYWETLAQYNKNTRPCGIGLYMSKYEWKKELAPEGTLRDLDGLYYSCTDNMVRDGIPIFYSDNDSEVFLLQADVARVASDEELDFLLNHNVITDGETVDVLEKRGVRLGMSAHHLTVGEAGKLKEVMTNHPVNPPRLHEWQSNSYAPGKDNSYYIDSFSDKTEVLSYYESSLEEDRNEAAVGKAASVVTTLSGGAKWAVFAYTLWRNVISCAKRNQLLNAADYISGNSLAARIDEPMQAMLLPRTDMDGKTVCVSVVNCTIGESGAFELTVRNPKTADFRFMSQHAETAKLEYTRKGSDFILKLPSISGWSVGTVFCG